MNSTTYQDASAPDDEQAPLEAVNPVKTTTTQVYSWPFMRFCFSNVFLFFLILSLLFS